MVKRLKCFKIERGDISLTKIMLGKLIFPYEKIVIVGFSGAGKTTYAQSLSLHLCGIDKREWKSIDLDQELFLLLKEKGESHLGEVIERLTFKVFREHERAWLFKILNSFEPPFVLSLGGGAYTDQVATEVGNQKNVLTIFLNTSFDLCYERIQDDPTRPLSKLGKEVLRALYFERLPNYEKAQEHLIDLDFTFIDSLMLKKH